MVKQLVIDSNEKLPDGIPPAIITPLRSGKPLNTKVRFSSISYILQNIAHKFRIPQGGKVGNTCRMVFKLQPNINYSAEWQEDRWMEGAKLMSFVFDTKFISSL